MLAFIVSAATSPSPDWTWFTSGGSLTILGGVLWAVITGKLVPGGVYREACEQRDRAIDQVYRLADTAARGVEVAERKGSS